MRSYQVHEYVFGALMAALGVAFVFCVWMMIVGFSAEHDRWERFKVDHQCVVVGKIDGAVFPTTGIGANGQLSFGIGSTPSRTGWKCDDGMTYWK